MDFVRLLLGGVPSVISLPMRACPGVIAVGISSIRPGPEVFRRHASSVSLPCATVDLQDVTVCVELCRPEASCFLRDSRSLVKCVDLNKSAWTPALQVEDAVLVTFNLL